MTTGKREDASQRAWRVVQEATAEQQGQADDKTQPSSESADSSSVDERDEGGN